VYLCVSQRAFDVHCIRTYDAAVRFCTVVVAAYKRNVGEDLFECKEAVCDCRQISGRLPRQR